jgi:hypothetical protein
MLQSMPPTKTSWVSLLFSSCFMFVSVTISKIHQWPCILLLIKVISL